MGGQRSTTFSLAHQVPTPHRIAEASSYQLSLACTCHLARLPILETAGLQGSPWLISDRRLGEWRPQPCHGPFIASAAAPPRSLARRLHIGAEAALNSGHPLPSDPNAYPAS